ncbi:MAG: hypothetical protein ACLR4M_08205 [Blautia sp.]
MESRNSVHNITAHLLEKGCTLPGFMGDIGYAQSNRERYEGFCRALMDAGKTPNPSLCLTTPLGIDSTRKSILSFLPFRMPDAFVCASDYVACIRCGFLKRGLRGGRCRIRL